MLAFRLFNDGERQLSSILTILYPRKGTNELEDFVYILGHFDENAQTKHQMFPKHPKIKYNIDCE